MEEKDIRVGTKNGCLTVVGDLDTYNKVKSININCTLHFAGCFFAVSDVVCLIASDAIHRTLQGIIANKFSLCYYLYIY